MSPEEFGPDSNGNDLGKGQAKFQVSTSQI